MCQRRRLDKSHGLRLKLGVHRFLYGPVVVLRGVVVAFDRRMVEKKLLWLYRVSMNTVGALGPRHDKLCVLD